MLGADHVSLGQAMLHSFDAWFFGNGRLYPVAILEKYVVFYVFTNLIAYKLFLIVSTIVAVELFRRCVAAYATVATGNLSAAIVATLFAERGYHDSILAYNGMLQLVAILVFCSLMLYRRALLLRDGRTLAASTFLYAVAALTYEVTYPLCVVYLAIAGFCNGSAARRRLSPALPFLAVAILLAAVSLLARTLVKLPAHSGYSFEFVPGVVLRTALMQIVAALPLSYWLFDPSGIFGRSDLADFLRNAPLSPAVFALSALVAWLCLRAARRESVRAGPLIGVGLLVLVLPALPIAVTAKYQRELHFGLGYLPVFLEVFGVALIAAAAAQVVMRRFGSWQVRAALGFAFAAVATMTQATNVRLVREGIASRDARTTLERQLSGALGAQLHDGDIVAVSPRFDWLAYDDDGPDGISTRGLFFLYAGRRVVLVPSSSPHSDVGLSYDRSTQRWTFERLRRR